MNNKECKKCCYDYALKESIKDELLDIKFNNVLLRNKLNNHIDSVNWFMVVSLIINIIMFSMIICLVAYA